jgi:DNA-binding transcriptional MocR family regulator
MENIKKIFRYQYLAGEIEQKINTGAYQPGDKLPSIRKLHKQSGLSISTVYKAFLDLETMGLIEPRPKSGYYVSPISLNRMKAPKFKKISFPPAKIRLSSMTNAVLSAINNPGLLPLGMTVTDPQLLPFKQFARIIKSFSHQEIKAMLSYSLSEGHPGLRRQLALNTVGLMKGITPDDIIITNGCMEAIALALLAITRPGDAVAIESPTNFSYLQLLQELGVLVVEIPANPQTGLDIDEFEKVLQTNAVKACLFMPNFHNPLGAVIPDESKERLVRMANRHELPIIEDDISSELYFGEQRPVPLKTFDQKELVITCSSFSKTLGPGLRIGWVMPGERFKEKIQSLKGGINVSTSTLDQSIVSRYLESGAYERQMRSLRGALKKQMVQTALAIQKYFPEQTRLAVPRGGSLLWVELPSTIDAMAVYQKAIDHHIAVIPGAVCSNSRQFAHYIQISCGSPFTPEIEKALKTLGRLIHEVGLSGIES